MFNYQILKSRIIEVFGSQKNFAKAMRINESTLSKKMNGVSFFDQDEIDSAISLLGIPREQIVEYFFNKETFPALHTLNI